MSGAREAGRELIVAVERESYDGKLYSCIREHPKKSGPAFVVDRQHGRQMDANVIQSRARSLAVLLGFRYLYDPRWRCVAQSLTRCACPSCTGVVTDGQPEPPEPEPLELCARTREPVATLHPEGS